MDWNNVLNIVTLAALGVGGYLLMLVKTAAEEAVKKSAESGADAALRKLQWPAEFARELQKTRGVQRQEQRFESYGGLWKELRPLAVYDDAALDKATLDKVRKSLSDWYFSACGGMLLTSQARDFYFGLQDLVQKACAGPDWNSLRSAEDPKYVLRELLRERGSLAAIRAYEYVLAKDFSDWEKVASDHGKGWRNGLQLLGDVWTELSDAQRFAVLQQAGSVLRTGMTNDVESRLR